MEMAPLFILVLAAMAQVPYCGGGAIDHGQALSNNIPFLEEQQSGVFPGKPGNSVQRPFAKSQVDDILFLGSSNTQDLGASVRPNSALVSCHDDERNNREQGEASTYNGAPFMAVLVTGHGGSGLSLEEPSQGLDILTTYLARTLMKHHSFIPLIDLCLFSCRVCYGVSNGA
jgi:hypothetical protein